MSLANCSRCGKVFALFTGSRDVCQACIKEEDDNYLKIFHYLSTRPAATASEIAQATEVDIKEIYCYVRENRLRLIKIDAAFSCESCGIPISQGKICDNCRQKLSEEMKGEVDKIRQNRPKESLLNQQARDPKYLKDRRRKDKGP
jgi:flagellar operon protein (TIGR03826 family)